MPFLVIKKLLYIKSKNPHTFGMDFMVGEGPWEVQDHTRCRENCARGVDVPNLPERRCCLLLLYVLDFFLRLGEAVVTGSLKCAEYF